MALAPAPLQHVTVLDRCEVPPAPLQPRALPLTFFNLVFWDFPLVQHVLFYHGTDHDVRGFLRSELPLLKASLTAALHHFYPLAWRLPCELPAEPEVACSDGDSIRLTVAVGADDLGDLAGHHPHSVNGGIRRGDRKGRRLSENPGPPARSSRGDAEKMAPNGARKRDRASFLLF